MSHVEQGVERAAQTATPARSGGGVGVAELSHGAIRDQVSDYVDGSLSVGDRQRVEDHLVECRACSAYLETLRETVDLLGQLPPKTCPPDAKAAILRRAHAS